jgi:hypothetical protein
VVLPDLVVLDIRLDRFVGSPGKHSLQNVRSWRAASSPL